MEIPFTTVGHFIAVIFVSVHCIVVLLLTLGREHTGEKYICCYVEEYDQLVFIFQFIFQMQTLLVVYGPT